MAHKRPRRVVAVGFLGKIAVISSHELLAHAEAEAMRLRAKYPDPRAEFWVSSAMLFSTTKWENIECRLQTVGAPKEIFRQPTRGRVDKRTMSWISAVLTKWHSGERVTDELIGFDYTLSELVAHLERQFKPGMSWDNRGEWHIDHIKPRSSFDMRDPKQLAECWSLRNLQPLWAEENMAKGKKAA